MQHEVTDVQKLLDKQGYVVTPGWARRPVWQYNRENIYLLFIKGISYYLAGNEHYAVAFTLSDLGYAGQWYFFELIFVGRRNIQDHNTTLKCLWDDWDWGGHRTMAMRISEMVGFIFVIR